MQSFSWHGVIGGDIYAATMWLKKALITVCLAVGFVLAGGMYYSDVLSGEADEYQRLVSDYGELARKTESIERECARLEAEKAALVDPDQEYLETVIWQEIRMVRPDDVVVRFE